MAFAADRQTPTVNFCLNRHGPDRCSLGNGIVITSSVMVAFAVLYFLLYCYFLRRALRQLSDYSNVEFKLANTIVRIQVMVLITLLSVSIQQVLRFLVQRVYLVQLWQEHITCKSWICQLFRASHCGNSRLGKPDAGPLQYEKKTKSYSVNFISFNLFRAHSKQNYGKT